LEDSIKEALKEIGGIGTFVKSGDRVLLKPNVLGSFKPENAATTHPEFIRAVIKIIKECGALPFVGESPGFGSLERFLEITGIKKILDEENVPFVEFKTPKDIHFKEGKLFKNFKIAEEIYGFDILINLPKFKTHVLTGISGAMKNLFGCIPGILKSQYHYKIQKRKEFVEMLEDLAGCIKPKLTIMDAVVGMEGDGPASGTPKFLGIVGASTDVFDIDSIMSKIIDGEPFGEILVSDFKKPEMAKDVMHLPFPWIQEFIFKKFSEKPVIDRQKCINCGICIKVCAAKAISQNNPTPKYNYDKCIRCFCCQEMCPQRAISIKRNKLLDGLLSFFGRI